MNTLISITPTKKKEKRFLRPDDFSREFYQTKISPRKQKEEYFQRSQIT